MLRHVITRSRASIGLRSFSTAVPAMYKVGSDIMGEMTKTERPIIKMLSSVQDRMANIPMFAHETERSLGMMKEMPRFDHKVLRTQPDVVEGCIPLICKRGAMLEKEGFDILEFDMAGSGYLYMPQMHKNRSGEPECAPMKTIAESVWRGMQHVVSPRSHQAGSPDKGLGLSLGTEVLKGVARTIRKIRQAEERDKAQMDVFGTKVTLPDGKVLEYARKKVDGHKTQYTISGPSVFNIMGNYTTWASRQYMLMLASDYLEGKFTEAIQSDGGILERPICIKIKGHSRGGVTSAEGATMISRWIKDNYPQFYNSVLFDIIQFDPVPGSDTFYPVAKMIDFRTKGSDGTGRFDSWGVKYAALDDSAQTTVVYSARTQYPVFFTPQIVKGADRIIITPYDHSVGLRNVDTNRVLGGAESGTQEGHRQAFVDKETQTAYSLGALNGLPRGAYILRKDNVLERVHSFEVIEHFMDESYKDARSQRDRCEAIKKSARDLFARLDSKA